MCRLSSSQDTVSQAHGLTPSIAPQWPHSESPGPGCATTWPAVRRRVALHSSIAGVAFRADGCLPSGGRARSESVSASCAMVGWALSIGLIDWPFSHWTHVTFKHGKAGAQSDKSHQIEPCAANGGVAVRFYAACAAHGARASHPEEVHHSSSQSAHLGLCSSRNEVRISTHPPSGHHGGAAARCGIVKQRLGREAITQDAMPSKEAPTPTAGSLKSRCGPRAVVCQHRHHVQTRRTQASICSGHDLKRS